MNKATPVDYRAVDYLPWTAETRLRFPRRSLLSRLSLSARTFFMKLFSIHGNCSASFAWESGDESPQSKVLRTWLCLLSVALAWVGPGQAAVTAMILAGDETGLPVDTPSAHLDKAGRGQYFHGRLWRALRRHWRRRGAGSVSGLDLHHDQHPGAGSHHLDVDCGFLHVPSVACGLRGENRIRRAV